MAPTTVRAEDGPVAVFHYASRQATEGFIRYQEIEIIGLMCDFSFEETAKAVAALVTVGAFKGARGGYLVDGAA